MSGYAEQRRRAARVEPLKRRIAELEAQRAAARWDAMLARAELAEAYDDLDLLARWRGLADTYDHDRQRESERADAMLTLAQAYHEAVCVPDGCAGSQCPEARAIAKAQGQEPA